MVTPSGPPSLRLTLGQDVYVAITAARARSVAYVLTQGAEVLRQRDGIADLPWLDELLEVLRQVHGEAQVEPQSEHAPRVSGSAGRTDRDVTAADPALWAHDVLTISEAADLTGWSAGYLARLGRDGCGAKRGGLWYLDRRRLLALYERSRCRGA